MNTELFGPTEDLTLNTERRVDRALAPPVVAREAAPASKAQPLGRSEGPQEFTISSARESDAILPDGSAPASSQPRPKKLLPQRKDVPPKAAPPGHEGVQNGGAPPTGAAGSAGQRLPKGHSSIGNGGLPTRLVWGFSSPAHHSIHFPSFLVMVMVIITIITASSSWLHRHPNCEIIVARTECHQQITHTVRTANS
jgi:hypothetical protein